MKIVWIHGFVQVQFARSNFSMTSIDISMSSMFGYCLLLLHQVWSEKSDGLSLVKTELNWALRISVCSLGESFSTPFSFKGAISTESVFLCLMKYQSLFYCESYCQILSKFSV